MLPDDLKRRIARLAASSGQTPHAFMVDALAREAERSEPRQRFAAEAAEAEREVLGSGEAHSLAATSENLTARVAGKNPRRPRARSWRASK
jgi:predicted transcriptional regulator